jgi:O-methyltransferase
MTVPDATFEVGDSAIGQLRDRYLELLIGALTHTLYAGIDVLRFPDQLKKLVHDDLRAELRKSEAPGVLLNPQRLRAEGRDWPQYGQTMIGLERLRSLRKCVEIVIANRIPGDLIEAGVWRGGAAILMRGVLAAYGDNQRRVWLADSFQGLPEPDQTRYRADPSDWAHSANELAVSVEEVRQHFGRYGLLDDRVRFVEGWFRDSLPALRDHRWSLVRLDGDMYESTMDGLVNLYEGVSPGGFLIIDDYALEPCRQAVEDFRRDRAIEDPIQQIDWTGVFWRKEGRRFEFI